MILLNDTGRTLQAASKCSQLCNHRVAVADMAGIIPLNRTPLEGRH